MILILCLPNTLCDVGGGVFRPCLADVQVQQQQQSAVHAAVVAQGRTVSLILPTINNVFVPRHPLSIVSGSALFMHRCNANTFSFTQFFCFSRQEEGAMTCVPVAWLPTFFAVCVSRYLYVFLLMCT